MAIQKRTDNEQAARRWNRLQKWYYQPAGQRFGAAEINIVRGILPFLFGYYMAAMGEPMDRDVLGTSPVSRQWLMGMDPSIGRTVDLSVEPEQLPMATDSIDVLVLSHVLECCENPVATLKEVDRVLIPDGYAVILGFNPLSLWGLYYGLGGRRQREEDFFQVIDACGVARLRSWLALLGLETVSVHYHSYCPPLREPAARARLAFLEAVGQRYCRFAGGGYVLLAKKRVSTLTPIRPRWFARQPLSTEGIAALYQGDSVTMRKSSCVSSDREIS